MEICKLEGFILKLKGDKEDRFVCWNNSYSWKDYLTRKQIPEYMTSEGWQPKIYSSYGKAKQAAIHLPDINKYKYEIVPVYITINSKED